MAPNRENSIPLKPRPSNILPHRDGAQNKDMYYIRDVYERLSNKKPIIPERAQGAYIKHLRSLATRGWPHIQYLVDFMDVTTAPPKMKFLVDKDRLERSNRVKVAVLDFASGEKVKRVDCTNIKALTETLRAPQDKINGVKGRLYVVEDLSSEVIEALGAKFDIDPLFFRGQISDYMWNNPRDPWVELPSLNVVARDRSFFCMRFFQSRYFPNKKSFALANDQLGTFNVLRRMDQNYAWEGREDFDQPGSNICFVRSKMSLWVRKNTPNEDTTLGILLVDPTIEEGFPLWGGYQNFRDCPDMKDSKDVKIPARKSLFEEVIFWTSQLTAEEILKIHSDPRLLVKKAMLIICGEWTMVIKYLTTRLTQLEWELDDNPTTPYRNPKGLSASLKSLNTWRRRMPVYQEWVSETVIRVINTKSFMGTAGIALSELADDFKNLQDDIAAVMARSDRIEGSITTIISIEESSKAMDLNRTAARLTYLAVIFVPLSWVSSFFSMQADLTTLKQTFWIYFTCAIPLTLIALLILRYSAIMDGFLKISDKISKS